MHLQFQPFIQVNRAHAFRRRFPRSALSVAFPSEVLEITAPESLIPFSNPDLIVTTSVSTPAIEEGSGATIEDLIGSRKIDGANIDTITQGETILQRAINSKFEQVRVREVENTNFVDTNIGKISSNPQSSIEETSMERTIEDQIIPMNTRIATVFRDNPERGRLEALKERRTEDLPSVTEPSHSSSEASTSKGEAKLDRFLSTSTTTILLLDEVPEDRILGGEDSGSVHLGLQPLNSDSRVQGPMENSEFKASDPETGDTDEETVIEEETEEV